MFITREKQFQIADAIDQCLSPQKFECIDVDWDAPTRTLCVYVDHPNGISFSECGQVSEILIEDKSIDELVGCDFNLEVSSPGVERPLRTLAHFECALSESADIDVKLTEKAENRRKGVGRILRIKDDFVTMTTAEGEWTFPRTSVLKAIKRVDWTKISHLEKSELNRIN